MAVTLTEPGDLNFTKNSIEYTFDFSGYSELKNYKVKYEILFQEEYRTGDYTKIVEGSVFPDANGKAKLDVSSIIHSAVKNAINIEEILPSLSATVPFVVKNSRQFKIKYVEEYGIPPEEQSWIEGAEKIAFAGGIDSDIWSERSFLNNSSIFSNHPTQKTVGINQSDFLSFFNASGGHVAQVQFHKTDGTSNASTITGSVGANEIICYPVGPANFSLPAKTYKYTITIGGETRVYYVNPRFYQWKYDLIYLNGFGCPEVFRCTGTSKRKLKVSRFKAQNEEEIKQVDYDFSQVMLYRSGYLKKDDIKSAQEFLVYNELYEIDSENSNFIPLDLLDDSYELDSTRSFLHALQFSARISTKKKIIPIQ